MSVAGGLVVVGVAVDVAEVGVLVTVVVLTSVVEEALEVALSWPMAGRIKTPSFRKQNTGHIMAVAII